jgi:hypothetical protein
VNIDPNLLVGILSILATLSAAYWQVRTMIRIAKPSSKKTSRSSRNPFKVVAIVSYVISGAAIIGANVGLRSMAAATSPLNRVTLVVACLYTAIMLIGIIGLLFTMLLYGLRGIFDELFDLLRDFIKFQEQSKSLVGKETKVYHAAKGKE